MLFIIKLLLSVAHATTCPITVNKTMLPLDHQVYHQDLCINNYFLKRDLAKNSVGEDKNGFAVIVEDKVTLDFDDMLLFSTSLPLPLGETGRLELIGEIYKSYLTSLKSEHGVCELKIFSDKTQLSINDFIKSDREEGGQPGTRLSLTKDDIKNPSWELWCTDKDQKMVLTKQGSYIFVFIDVYENIGTTGLIDHLTQFLLAFR